jgi:hypothetical protein
MSQYSVVIIADQIRKMSMPELLEHVITHPFHLTDSYYVDIRHAIIARHTELLQPVSTPWGYY